MKMICLPKPAGIMHSNNMLKGYSLVELMIVIALLAIASTIAIPAWQRYVQNSNLRTATRELTSDIVRLKTRAISEKIQYRISFPTLPASTYTIDQGTATGTPYNTIQTKDLSVEGRGVNISNTSIPRITFQPRGTCLAGTFVLTNSLGSTATIVTNITGRINVTYQMQ
jgi:prepilin-type N-terminal cleavage/methylation domain-containing protein